MSSIIARRNLLRGLFAAPAIIAIDRLMPVKVWNDPFPEMGINIEKIVVEAKSRVIKAQWTMERANFMHLELTVSEAPTKYVWREMETGMIIPDPFTERNMISPVAKAV